MQYKIYSLSFLFLLIASLAFSQETKYYSLSGGIITKDDCYYYSIEKTIDGKLIDTVKSYYCKSNKLKSVDFYLMGKLDGPSIEYFPNGNLKSTSTYKGGRPVEQKTIYYSSGIKRASFIYKNPDSEFDWDYLIENTWDSLGRPGVQNKNGFCTSLLTFFGEEIGYVKDGVKDSVWQIFDPQTKIKLLEDTYQMGKFLKGKRYQDNKIIEYDIIEVTAVPKGGMPSFYREIGSKLKYPREARRAGIKGKVFVQFIVNIDGTIQDAKCIRGIGGGCDEAAVEAINQVKPWIPGMQKGIPVKQRYTLPIIFSL
jgi:TonB family protein